MTHKKHQKISGDLIFWYIEGGNKPDDGPAGTNYCYNPLI